MNLQTPFRFEFTSCKVLLQIKDDGADHDAIFFYSFPNDHYYTIGYRKFVHLPYLVNKNQIAVNVWIVENPVYSSALQFMSTRFNEQLKEAFKENDIANQKLQEQLRVDEKTMIHINRPINVRINDVMNRVFSNNGESSSSIEHKNNKIDILTSDEKKQRT